MKVSVIDEKSGQTVIDGSTEEYDERKVHLDSLDLQSSRSYIIKYEFFEKNVGLKSFEDRLISAGHMGAIACSKPFVIQELTIISKDLISQRIKDYRDSHNLDNKKMLSKLGGDEHQISDIDKRCDFSTLNNEKASYQHGENGLYCGKQSYTYSLGNVGS